MRIQLVWAEKETYVFDSIRESDTREHRCWVVQCSNMEYDHLHITTLRIDLEVDLNDERKTIQKLKEIGNIHFKNRNFIQAIKFFIEAIKVVS